MVNSIIRFNSAVAGRVFSFEGMQEVANVVVQARDWTKYLQGSVGAKFDRLALICSTGQAWISALRFAQTTKDLFTETKVYELGSVDEVSLLGTQVKKVQKVASAILGYHTTLNFLRINQVIEISQAAMQRWDGVFLALNLFTIAHWAYSEVAKFYTGKVTGKMVVSKEDGVEVKKMTRMHQLSTLLNALSASLLLLSIGGAFTLMGPFWVLFFSTFRLFLSMSAYYLDKLS